MLAFDRHPGVVCALQDGQQIVEKWSQLGIVRKSGNVLISISAKLHHWCCIYTFLVSDYHHRQRSNLGKLNPGDLFAIRIRFILRLRLLNLGAIAEEERNVSRMERLRDSFLSLLFSLKLFGVQVLAHFDFLLITLVSAPVAPVDNVSCLLDLPRKYSGHRDLLLRTQF